MGRSCCNAAPDSSGNLMHKQMEGEDWAGAFIKFEDGTYATIEANYVTTGGMEDVIDIYCDKGCIHVDLTFSGPLRVFSISGLSSPLPHIACNFYYKKITSHAKPVDYFQQLYKMVLDLAVGDILYSH